MSASSRVETYEQTLRREEAEHQLLNRTGVDVLMEEMAPREARDWSVQLKVALAVGFVGLVIVFIVVVCKHS